MAGELTLSSDTSAGWDSNMRRDEVNDKDAVSIRIAPIAAIRDKYDSLSYRASYQPVYQVFLRSGSDSGSDIKDHFAQHFRGSLNTVLGGQTSLRFDERFRLSQSIARFDDDDDGVDSAGEVERNNIYSNQASLTAMHPFSPRTRGTFKVSHGYRNSTQRNTATSNSLAGTARALYTFNKKHQLGGGGSSTWQTFEKTDTRSKQDTLFHRLFVSWVYSFDESTKLSLDAGPMFILTNVSDDGEDWETKTKASGSASFHRRWDGRNNSSVTFSVTDSGATTLGESTVAKTLSLRHRWKVTERLGLSLVGQWSSRDSPMKEEFAGLGYGVDTENWRASTSVSYRVSRRGSMNLNASYQKQKSNDVAASLGNSEFDNVRIRLGFRYNFDPLHF
jgi:hypothetical protein